LKILNNNEMKNFIIIMAIALSFLNSSNVLSQISTEKWDVMLIREDHVYPSKTDDYEMSLMDMKNLLTEKGVDDFNYYTHVQDDYTFTHVVPVDDFQGISGGLHSNVVKNVNDPRLDLILEYLNESIKSYRYYVVKYRPEFSFVPEGDLWGVEHPYRRWGFYNFQPGTEAEVEKVLMSWKHLYETKGIKTGFRVFSGLIGIEQPVYILTTWAENPLHYQENLQNTSALLGEQGAALWSKMMQYVGSTKTVEGWFLPQYSFYSE
jgi:hypothetical protein